MANQFHLPDIGEGLTEAVVVSWHVAVGEAVALDEPLVEIETDKSVVDIPSPFAGTLLHQGAGEGATMEVDALLAVIGEPGETWGEEPDRPSGAAPLPIVGSLEEAPPAAPPPRAQALPMVRKLAKELGVDLATVEGTGPGGRITEDDVHNAGESRPVRRAPMSQVRKTIADRMTRSWREIPHVTTFGEALAQPLLTTRDDLGKPPLEALIISRVLPLLADHPLFNAVVDGTDIVERGFYDIGFAVNAPQGLLVAVVHDADQKSVDEIGSEVVRLADAARSRRLSPDDASGQTFTVSNIGAVGGRFGTPIIPLGTSAILSVGRADPRPVVDDGEIVVARVFPLSLSYDHRLIDGAEGRSFMADLIETLERP